MEALARKDSCNHTKEPYPECTKILATQQENIRQYSRKLDKRLADTLENRLMVAGEGVGRGFGMGMYTLLYLKWITSKVLLYSTGSSAQCHVAAWMRGKFGEEWIHVYVWLTPFTVHLKLSQHC